MDPLREHHDAVEVAGLTGRTTNADEADPITGRIPALWGRFFAENVMGTTPDRDPSEMRNFGVYSNYESDLRGAFDVTVGVAVTGGGTVRIEAGDYLVFSANGPMPHSVVGAWLQAWQYFEAHPEVKRRYVSDFEAYTSPISASVHIGVE